MEKEQEIKIEEISKEQFLNFLDNQRTYWEDVFLRAQTEILKIERMEKQLNKLEERGYLVYFYFDGENCFYEAKPKPPVGFETERREE